MFYLFNIVEKSIEEFSLSGDDNIKVSINCMLNEKLINEGIVRDLIRKVQNLRKDSNFEISDRIKTSIKCNDKIFLATGDGQFFYFYKFIIIKCLIYYFLCINNFII